MALAALELCVQFSRLCGQNCFRLSFDTLLEAVRSSCDDGVDAATLMWFAAATGAGALLFLARGISGLTITRAYTTTGVRQVQLSVEHGFYEALRWHFAHPDAMWSHTPRALLCAGMRPRNAYFLLVDAMRRWPDMQASIFPADIAFHTYSTHYILPRPLTASGV